MRDLNPKDINRLISIQGIVIRNSEIYPEMKDAFFKCSFCGNKDQSPIDRGRIQEPTNCKKCATKHSFELIHNLCMFTDKQYIKLQETPNHIPEGETPQNVNLIVYDDMVDNCKPGDKIEITGIYRAQGLRTSKNKRILKSVFKTYVDVVSINSTHRQKFNFGEEDDIDELIYTEEQRKKFHD